MPEAKKARTARTTKPKRKPATKTKAKSAPRIKPPQKMQPDTETNETAIIQEPTQKKPYRTIMPRKTIGSLARPTKEAIKLSADYDIPPDEAYQIITGKKPDYRTVDRMTIEVDKWSLRHPDSLRAASKSIKAFAQGKAVNGIVPKCSTVSAAAMRVIDATDPVIKRSENLNINADLQICPVDLDKLFNR